MGTLTVYVNSHTAINTYTYRYVCMHVYVHEFCWGHISYICTYAHIHISTYINNLIHKAQCICTPCTATHCNTLQHTVTHCNTLQYTATRCNTLQHTCIHRTRHVSTHCTAIQDIATHCNGLLHIATHCNTLEHTATHCSTTHYNTPACSRRGLILHTPPFHRLQTPLHCDTLPNIAAAQCTTLQHSCIHRVQRVSTHCTAMKYTVIHCNTLQHTATHCNTMQRTATQHTAAHLHVQGAVCFYTPLLSTDCTLHCPL